MNLTIKDKIEDLEIAMLKEEQEPCPVIHSFSPGIYIREVHLSAGIFAVGHYQKKEHLNVFLQGKVTMLHDDGTTEDLEAPMKFIGQPGRKCGFIHEDVVWLNIYPTDETDIETLENTYLDKSEGWKANLKLVDMSDKEDYKKALKELGFTEETVRAQSEEESDQIPMPYGSYKFMVSSSSIEGKGIFATAPIVKGEEIAPARIDDKRTPVGRYTNHSSNPNAEMVKCGNIIMLIAIEDISGCKGGLPGEEITTNYRNNVRLICQE